MTDAHVPTPEELLDAADEAERQARMLLNTAAHLRAEALRARMQDPAVRSATADAMSASSDEMARAALAAAAARRRDHSEAELIAAAERAKRAYRRERREHREAAGSAQAEAPEDGPTAGTERVLAILREALGGDEAAVQRWLDTPHHLLGGVRPAEALQRPGGIDGIEQMLLGGLWGDPI